MTPAINLLTKNNIDFKIHKYSHDSSCTNFGLEAALKLNIKEEFVFKTLLVELTPKELTVAIIPVNKSLCLKSLAKFFHVKNAKMANKDEAQKVTGYLLGGISPFGQRKLLRTLVDESANTHKHIYVSGGKRGLDLEIEAISLSKILKAEFASIGI